VESARSCRAFLSRVVTYLTAEAGIRQFLDLGSGLPSAQNVHEVAQSIAPQSRVVYVDHDPIVLLHARALLRSRVAVMLLAVLHFVTDDQDPAGIIRAVMDAAAPRSYLAIDQRTADIYPEVSAFAARPSELNPAFPSTLRDRQQVRDLFAGLDLVKPGVVQISRWRPEPGPGKGSAPLWGGVARKP
jgi:hypothetical protein